jgi:hypothetical protein
VKTNYGNRWNELADHLAKEEVCSGEVDIAYIKIQKSAVIIELKEKRCRSVAKTM